MYKEQIPHHSNISIYARNVKYNTNSPAKDLIHLMEHKPSAFKEWFILYPLGFLNCCNEYPNESYAFVKANQNFFNDSNWLDKSNLKSVMNFARENPQFFSLVMMPWLKKNLGKAIGLLHDLPEFKENLKYDFPKQYKEIMEMINPRTINPFNH